MPDETNRDPDYIPLDVGGPLWMALKQNERLPFVGQFGVVAVPDKQRIAIKFIPDQEGIVWLTCRAVRSVGEQFIAMADATEAGAQPTADDIAYFQSLIATYPRPSEILDLAWGLIANAGGGDWDKETPEWRGAADRWRDLYFKWLELRRKDPAYDNKADHP